MERDYNSLSAFEGLTTLKIMNRLSDSFNKIAGSAQLLFKKKKSIIIVMDLLYSIHECKMIVIKLICNIHLFFYKLAKENKKDSKLKANNMKTLREVVSWYIQIIKFEYLIISFKIGTKRLHNCIPIWMYFI